MDGLLRGTVRWLVGALLFIFVANACFAASVSICVLAKRGKEKCLKKWGATADYLSNKIPTHKFRIVPLDFQELIPSVEEKECDFVLSNPAFYVELESRFGVSRIATLENLRMGKGYVRFGGVIFCRSDRKDIRNLEDLEGKSFAAPSSQAFAAWIAVLREMKGAGIDPYREFKSLRFLGTHDAVVYAVRDGKVDAGSVRTDTLERMAMEGKIRLADFHIIAEKEMTDDFPFVHSTRLYPEWPFAKAKHTSRDLAEKVLDALLTMPADSAAARAALCEGWTIPLNYQPVHQCLKELRLGPYRDYGKVTFSSFLRQYWPVVLLVLLLMITMGIFLAIYLRIALKLRREVEERARAEDALRRSEEFLEHIFNAIQDGISVLDTDLNIVMVNWAMEKWYGGEPLVGRKCYEAYHNRTTPCESCPTRRAIELKRVEREVVPGKSGSSAILLEVYSFPILDELGEVTGVVEYVRDITKTKEVEEKLRKAAEEWMTTFNATEDAIWVLDENQTIVRCNRKAREMFQKPGHKLVGRKCWTVVHGTETPPPECPFLSCKRSGKRESMGFELGGRSFRISSDPIFDKNGELVGAVHSVTDVSELKRAKEESDRLMSQLVQIQKIETVGRLAGGVAHDFNNMLSAVLGYSDLIMESLDSPDSVRTYTEEIQKAASRSADIVRQLLAFARKQMINPKVLDLNEVIEGMLKMLRRLLGENIRVEWLPATHLWKVRMDPSQIDQIVVNLCVNARDAIENTGTITIGTQNAVIDEEYTATHLYATPGEYVVISVSDDGCGMDKEVLEKIFEPFFTTKEAGKGTGMGLATVYGIVKQNGGHISVYSEVGKGSTFRIYLPRYAGDEEAEEGDGGDVIPSGTETVLVVEDEESILEVVKRILSSLGYTVLATNDAQKALRLAKEHAHEISLLITDVVMPNMSGKALAEEVMKWSPQAKCIYMSGYTQDVLSRQDFVEEGVHFLQKPFSKVDLAVKVREVLDGN